MYKKTTMAILGLSISGIAAAGMYSAPPAPTCVPGDVTVPCEAKKWDLGIQALYLRPVYDADRVYENVTSDHHYNHLDTDWDWGFRLEGSYHFSTGNDITMNWTHYDNDHSQGGFNGALLTPIPQITFPVSADFSQEYQNKFDQVNLVFGQHVDMGMVKNARFYGGLQYADIRLDTQNNYVTPANLLPIFNLAGITSISAYRNADFNGVGPVTGIDYSYDLSNSFSITANGAAAILYGTSRTSSGWIASNGLMYRTLYGSKKAIVPELEAKLGVNYAHMAGEGVLNIQAGYQVMNYFNALQTSPLITVAGVIPAVKNTDYGLYGPYFGVKWIGNA